MKPDPRIRYKKLTREEALHLKAALRAIRGPAEDLLVEWRYHRIQQQKVRDALSQLLESHGLELHFDPEGSILGIDYRNKLHLRFQPRLSLWGWAEWDLSGISEPMVLP